jgi:hypothetical protein
MKLHSMHISECNLDTALQRRRMTGDIKCIALVKVQEKDAYAAGSLISRYDQGASRRSQELSAHAKGCSGTFKHAT